MPSDAASDAGSAPERHTGGRRVDQEPRGGPRGGRRGGRPILAAVLVGSIVTVDQLTKLWAVRDLADGPVAIVGDTIDFRLARNTGGAFSLFQAFTPLLAVVAGAVAFLLVRAVRRTHDTLTVVALSLVLGGALGNLGDRLFRSPGLLRGAVVDFVHLGAWPTFNVADSAITVGALVLVFDALRPRAVPGGGESDA